MKNKFVKIALTVLTIAVVGQIGMRLFYPQPETAKAANVTIKLTVVSWDGPEIEPYDIQPTAQFLASDFSPIGDPFAINMGLNESNYSVSVDAPSNAVYVQYSWDGDGWDWGLQGQGMAFGSPPFDLPDPVSINWTGPTQMNVWVSFNAI